MEILVIILSLCCVNLAIIPNCQSPVHDITYILYIKPKTYGSAFIKLLLLMSGYEHFYTKVIFHIKMVLD